MLWFSSGWGGLGLGRQSLTDPELVRIAQVGADLVGDLLENVHLLLSPLTSRENAEFGAVQVTDPAERESLGLHFISLPGLILCLPRVFSRFKQHISIAQNRPLVKGGKISV